MKSAISSMLFLSLLLAILVACSDPPVASVPSPVVGGVQASSTPRSTQPTARSATLVSTVATASSPVPSSSVTVVPSEVLAPTEASGGDTGLSATVFNGGNVRETPVNGRPLDQINARETVRLLGKNEAGTWYLITNLRGVTGWVSTTLLTIEPAVASQVPVTPASAVAIAPGSQPDLGQSPEPSGQLPDGWRVQQAGQFQLALPNSWRVLPLTRPDLEQLSASVEKSNPRLAQVVRQLLQSEQYQQMRFAAADASSRSDATANVNVIVTPRDVTQPVKQTLEATIKQLLQSLPAVNLMQSNTALKLNGMDGARIVYDLPIKQPDGGTVIVRGVQYYLIDGGNIDILTLTGPADVAFVTTADTIAKSLKTNAAPPSAAASAPPSAVVSTGRITNGGNLRSAPVLGADTVIGQVCPDDQVALIVAQERGGERWYRIRVLSIAQDCAAKRAQVGAEGWLNSTLVAPPSSETPTSETVKPTPTAT